ncbi:MAG TPA: carboxypeptidase-like regulatory domain-containing protein [Longimicrobiales bacterium]|nr:carboxypeptidase-like regulatory domain-containing protein [Longimicrobiales bacterium]
MRFRLLILLLLMVPAVAAPAAAQSVRGRVLDAETGSPIGGARVELLRGAARALETISDSAGRFVLVLRASGEYRLQASFLGYRSAPTEPFQVGAREQVIADIRMARAVIPLEALTIVARRADPRHEATEEGLYARRLNLPPIGTARVLLPLDGEMANARDARDVLQWLPRPRGCIVVYWNGHMVRDADMAQSWLETPTAHLEAVEFYGHLIDAPAVFRDVPPYLIECWRHSVVALWPRTGRYLTEYTAPPAVAFSWHAHVTPTVQHISGDYAPGIGIGLESSTQWRVGSSMSFGVHVSGTTYQLGSEQTAYMTRQMSNISYHLPPGDRPLTLWLAGVEPRVDILDRAALRVTAGARLQVARRSFTLVRNEVPANTDRMAAFGWGAGAVAGAELRLRPRLAVSAGVVRDWLWFERYKRIDPRATETAATWTVSGLRLGVTYSSAH